MKKVLILGAGIAGIAAARELKAGGMSTLLIEAEDEAGGLARSFIDDDGFVYDRGPHYFFSSLADKLCLRELCSEVTGYEGINYEGRYYKFPFGLARFPSFLFSVGSAYLKRLLKTGKSWDSLEELLDANYGSIFNRKILSPLVEKWSGEKGCDISADFGQRLLPPDLGFMVYSIGSRLRGKTEDYRDKSRIMVSPKGGMGRLFKEIIKREALDIRFGEVVQRMHFEGDRVASLETSKGEYTADFFVSTIPADTAVSISDSQKIRDNFGKFRFRGIVIVYLKIAKKKVMPDYWCWYPERVHPFYRVAEQVQEDGRRGPRSLISVEFGSGPGDEIWKMADDDLVRMTVENIRSLYGLDGISVLGSRVERIRTAYPVLLREYEGRQRMTSPDIGLENLYFAGRNGLFKYYLLEDAYESGLRAAGCIKLRTAAAG